MLVEIDFAIGAGVKYCGVVLDVRILVPGNLGQGVVCLQNWQRLAEETQCLLLHELTATRGQGMINMEL